MKTISKKNWLNHPLSVYGTVEEVPVSFLDIIKNPFSKDFTNESNESNVILHQNKVFDDIELNGMDEPFIVRIGYSDKTIRLESGNHRIKVAIERGYTHMPISCFVDIKSILYEGNGIHSFDASKIIDFDLLVKSPYSYPIKISDFLKIPLSEILDEMISAK